MSRAREDRDERGAVALMVAISAAVLVLVASYCVDLGMQRVVRTDMQSVADVAALDMARKLAAGVTPAQGAWDEALRTSLDDNASTLGTANRDEDGWVCTAKVCAQAIPGTVDANGVFTASESTGQGADAVKVVTSADVDFAFQQGSGAATRSAVARASSGACYKVGSWAASVNTENSVLLDPVLQQLAMQSGVFSDGAQVKAIDYEGLVQASVDLNALATSLGVGSADQLAGATVSLRSLYLAIKALAEPSNSTVVNALEILAANASSTAMVQLGKLLGVSSGNGSLMTARANVLDLVGGSISAVNGANVANVYLDARIPSLVNAGFAARLVQGPHQYCGAPGDGSTIGVASDTEQLHAHLGGNLNPVTIDFLPPVIPGLLTSVASASITAQNYVTFDLSVAGTTATLRSVACGNPAGITLDIHSGLATVTIATPLHAEVRGSLLGLAVKVSIDATVQIVATVSPSRTFDYSITVPPQQFDTPYPTTSGGLSIGTATIQPGANVSANVALVAGLGASVHLSADQAAQLLSTIVNSGLRALLSPTDPHSLSTTVIDPLLGLAGAEIGGADVILDSLPAPECGRPWLVG
ncbi:pilus assembly protein TadG-related protein [Nocardioides sp. DS6]|uniref:Pilus assembly protein TadG-related protein n=1 Tax=Nocardioides eburneus TaxID=3231482 RepID=A0ABV3SU34_9ACTN